jgi:hypothetical protein
MMTLINVNLVGVFAAGLASFVLGMLWYSPLLFGKPWMHYMKLKQQDMKKAGNKMVLSMLGGLLTAFVTAYVFAHLLSYSGAVFPVDALQVALWIWLGFFATTLAGSVLWESKPVGLYLLNAAYYLASLFVMALVLISV